MYLMHVKPQTTFLCCFLLMKKDEEQFYLQGRMKRNTGDNMSQCVSWQRSTV